MRVAALRTAARLSLPIVVMGLSACASVQVQRVATAGPEAAYNLEGTNMKSLEVEAQRLCPKGYDVTRQWQNYQRLNNDEFFLVRWVKQGASFANAPTEDKAQLSIICKP
mgnify:CR=1 FL=1